jgi:LysM repeat protein
MSKLLEESMNKKALLILTIALAAVTLLSACERSAVPAQSSLSTPSPGAQQTLSDLDAIKTQTAVGTATALYLTMQPGAPSSSTAMPPTATLLGAATAVPSNTPMPTMNTSVASPTPGKPATYKLQEGEFPYCLARRFDVNPSDLLSLNGIAQNQLLQPGFELKIPATGSFPGTRALLPHPTTYTVKLDDTIYSIACKFGDVDPLYLAAYNGIASPYVLQTGLTLNIP